jgi:hypothetical protein
MAHSLERNDPLSDKRVVWFGSGFPDHLKKEDRNEKYLLKQAFRGWIAQSIVRGNKQP